MAKQAERCPACGQDLPAWVSVCWQCGHPLQRSGIHADAASLARQSVTGEDSANDKGERGGADSVQAQETMIPAAPAFPRRAMLLGLIGLAVGGAGMLGVGVAAFERLLSSPALLTYRGHTDDVTSVAWSLDGRRIASASRDKTVHIWDAHDGHRLLTYRGHQQEVLCVAWSPDGTHLVSNESWHGISSSALPRDVHVWAASSGTTLLIRPQVFNFGATVVWSPLGGVIASAGIALEVWEATSGHTLLSYDHYPNVGGLDVAWSPDGQHLLAAGDEWLQVLNAQTAEVELPLPKASLWWARVAWSPNGKYLAAGPGDPSVQMWEAATGTSVLSFDRQQLEGGALAWSPDSRRLAAATAGTVQIWDASTGTVLSTYTGHQQSNWQQNGVLALAWSPDGKRIASAGRDHTVQIWQPG